MHTKLLIDDEDLSKFMSNRKWQLSSLPAVKEAGSEENDGHDESEAGVKNVMQP
jgi:hypothetical protein